MGNRPRLPTELVRLTIAGHRLELAVPRDPDALLNTPAVQARFAENEYLPYWATLWPAAIVLADAVAAWIPADVAGRLVLEIGGGLGLPSLIATTHACNVVLSDYDDDALALAVENARRNGLPLPATRRLDWTVPIDPLGADRILAADVLYERRNLEPVARFIARHLAPAGVAWVCDPGRSTADDFPAVAIAAGLTVACTERSCHSDLHSRDLHARLFELRRA